MSAIQVMYVQAHSNPYTHMHFMVFVGVSETLALLLNFREGKILPEEAGTSSYPFS